MLPTYDNLMSRGFNGPNCCVLCDADFETANHFFFASSYSRTIIASIKQWVKLHHTSCNLKAIFWLLQHHFKGDRWRAHLARSAIIASIYFIWMERNARLFNNVSTAPTVTIKKIKSHISVRLLHGLDDQLDNAKFSFLLN